MIPSIQAVLRQVPLFDALTAEELEAVTSRFNLLDLKTGEILFLEDDPGETLFIVAQGEIENIKSLDAPVERIIAVRGPSEYFGEMSLFSLEHRRTASARASTNTNLLTLTKSDFDALLQRHPQLAYEMVRVL